jgi:hypothetical protein
MNLYLLTYLSTSGEFHAMASAQTAGEAIQQIIDARWPHFLDIIDCEYRGKL